MFSVPWLCAQSLNGFVCGATVLSVQRSNFMPDLLPTKQHTTEVTALPSSTSYAVLSDPVVAIQVRYAAHSCGCLTCFEFAFLKCGASKSGFWCRETQGETAHDHMQEIRTKIR